MSVTETAIRNGEIIAVDVFTKRRVPQAEEAMHFATLAAAAGKSEEVKQRLATLVWMGEFATHSA